MKITKEYQKRFILQGIVSLFALMIIVACLSVVFDDLTDNYNPADSLLWDLNYGRYDEVVDYYYTTKKIRGTENEKVYGRYTEFTDFYENYILYVESRDETYRKKMEEIMTDTAYPDNEPHYEYIYERLETLEPIP